MRNVLTLIVTVLLVTVMATGASANGLALNSIGTRALGMGGAMVGLADDVSAIYWNPAGISNVEGGFAGFYLSGINPMATYTLEPFNISAESVTNYHWAPNFFATYQVDEWTFGLGVYVPAGLGIEWNGDDLALLSGGESFEWMSRIGVIDIAPAVSYKFSDQFSLGLAVNIYYAFFDMKRGNEVPSPPAPPNTFSQYTEESTGTGVGVTIGAQYHINEMWTLGATFRSKTTVNMSGEAEFPAFGLLGAPTKSDFDREVAWPMWIAGGVAVRPSECWVISFDVQYSQWSESEDVLVTEYQDPTWKAALEADDSHLFVLKWEDATQIRVGTEYLPSDDWALRLGYYYDPAPAPDETLNFLFPSSTNHVITGGLGYKAGNWLIEGAAEYLFGEERVIPLEPEYDQPGTHQMDIFAFSIGVGYGF